MFVHDVYAWCPQKPEEDIKSPAVGVTDNCESPPGCWVSNLGPLEEQQVPLIDESFPPGLHSGF